MKTRLDDPPRLATLADILPALPEVKLMCANLPDDELYGRLLSMIFWRMAEVNRLGKKPRAHSPR